MRSKWINKTRNPFTFEPPGTKQKVEIFRSRFGHFTENDKPRFAITVSPYPSVHIWDFRFEAAMFVFIHPLTSSLAWKLSSKLLFWKWIRSSIKKSSKQSFFFSNAGLWCFRVHSRAWSSRTNVNLKRTARFWSRDFLTLAVCGKCRKTSILRSLERQGCLC